jgi:hypothetical protein
MMIDLRSETTLNLEQAAARIPPYRRGRPVTTSCILRWILSGVKLPSGDVVKLEGIRLGKRWLTSVEALERFAARQTPGLEGQRGQPPRPPAKRQGASERAAKALEKLGI